MPEQITTNFLTNTNTKVMEIDPTDIEKGKSTSKFSFCKQLKTKIGKTEFSGDESDKEAVLRKRRNITNKQINDTYNLPTADKLIKPTGAHEHAGKYNLIKHIFGQHCTVLANKG